MAKRYHLLTLFVATIISSLQINAVAQDKETSYPVSKKYSSESSVQSSLLRSSLYVKRNQALQNFHKKVSELNITSFTKYSGIPLVHTPRSLNKSEGNINEQLLAESHINAIAHRYSDSESESDEWVLEYKTEFERTSEGLPERSIDTYFYYDEETDTVEEDVVVTEFEFGSNQLITSLTSLLDFDGEEVMFSKILLTYAGDPLKVDSYTEIIFSDFDENEDIIYDTTSADFIYENDKVTLELNYGESDISIITAYEGDDLVIEYDETWLDDDSETGEIVEYSEKYRETFKTLGTFTEYFNLFSSRYGYQHTPIFGEYFDTDVEDYVNDYRLTTTSTGDTTFYIGESWDEEEEIWSIDYETTLTFDENGKMSKLQTTYRFEDVEFYFQELINPAAEFLQFVSVEEEQQIPSTIRLHQNYPNPFNPSTQITFDLQSGGFVQLTVLDIMGREIATLVSQRLQAGSHQVEFLSSGLSSGVYLYRLDVSESGNARVSETRMMTLIK